MADLDRASAYDYHLPQDLIAQHPVEPRDESRLLVVERDVPRDGSPFRHLRFRDLPDLIAPGDALVLTETRVIPARIRGRKPTGAPAEVLLLRCLSDDERTWEALVRPGGKLKPGRVIDVEGGVRIVVADSAPGGGRVVRIESEDPARAAIERVGIADVANYSYIAHAPEGNVSLEPYPHIRAWLARIEALPGPRFERPATSVAPDRNRARHRRKGKDHRHIPDPSGR